MNDMHDVHLDSLELTQLRLLDAIQQTGSVSRGAHAIGLSQPAASHSLARLRFLLGDELFVRSARGVVPTLYGARLARAASEALEALRGGLASRRPFDPATAKAVFRIYMSDVGQLVLLPRLLRHLRHHGPGISLHVEHVPSTQQGSALEDGTVDAAIGHIHSLSAGFHQRTLFLERYVCVASMDNPRFLHGMSIEAFTESPHAVANASGMAHYVVDEALAAHGLQRRAGLVVPEFMTLPFLIAGSDLVVTMPGRLADQFAQLAPLRVMPPPVPLQPYEIRIFWHERAHQDGANQWFRRTVSDLFERFPRATTQAEL